MENKNQKLLMQMQLFQKKYSSNEITLHLEAIYTSRYMNFRNLPQSRNSLGVQVENSECKYYIFYHYLICII